MKNFLILLTLFILTLLPKNLFCVEINNLINWEKITDEAEFGERGGASAVVFKNKLWLLGGDFEGGFGSNEIYNSSDGVNWQQVNNTGFEVAYSQPTFIFHDKIYVLGGFKNTVNRKETYSDVEIHDVLSSENGVNWKKIATKTPHPDAVWVFQDQIWILVDDSVYKSNDFIRWSLVTKSTGFDFHLTTDSSFVYRKDRRMSQSIVFDGKMWLFVSSKEIYTSSDGKKWNKLSVDGPFVGGGFKCLVFENKIWVIDGAFRMEYFDLPDNLNPDDLVGGQMAWCSSDGIHWDLKAVKPTEESRWDHAVAVFKNKIWVLGGRAGSSDPFSDVWCLP